MNLSELRTALKERREDYSSSDAKLDRKINQAYLDICSRRKWGWLRREYTANTYAPHTVTGHGPPVNPGDPAATPNFAATNGSRQMGFMAGPGTADGHLPLNSLGKRILVGGSFYRIVQLNNDSANADLDRPYTGSTFPFAPGPPVEPDYGSAQLVYNEIALPIGAQSVVEATLFSGTTSYPLSLDSVRPASMSGSDKNVVAQPTRFSVVEKAPIRSPLSAISGLSGTTGGSLTPGATYTYWYSHYDKITGAESALSPSASVTLAPIQNAVDLPTITARNDFRVRIYRSRAGGNIPYILVDEDQASKVAFSDDIGDEYLGRRGPDSASTMFMTLYPSPSATYQIHILYQTEATTLGADNDRPLFDSTFSNVLLDGAEMLMLTSNDEQSRAGSVQARYEAGIQRMVMQDRMDLENHVLIGRSGRRVRGGRNWWYGSIPDYGSGGMGGFGAP